MFIKNKTKTKIMPEEFDLTETKWSFIKELENGTLSPKELANLTNTSIANTSQQLKLLEAQGFLKKIKNKGVNTRQKRDARVLYSIAKQKVWVSRIDKARVERKELKNVDDYLLNLLLCDIKDVRHVAKFFLEREDLMNKIKCLYYLQTINEEIHFLIITNELDFFRRDNHSFDVFFNKKKVVIKFWSHSLEELKKGLKNSEAYYVDLVKRIQPLKCEDEAVRALLCDWKK